MADVFGSFPSIVPQYHVSFDAMQSVNVRILR